MKTQTVKLFFAVLALCFLGGCGALNGPESIPSNAMIPTPSWTIQPPTITLTPIIAAPTYTPRPTLSADEAWSTIKGWLQDNDGCRFPCLWGFVPGETSVDAFQFAMARLGSVGDVSNYGKVGGFDVEFTIGDTLIPYGLSYRGTTTIEQLEVNAFGLRKVGDSTEGAPVFGDSPTSPLLHYYMPSQILSNYGQPSRVLIGAWYDDRLPPSESDWKFSIVLDYSESGILVEYLIFGKASGNKFVGCLSRAQDFTVWLWPPDEMNSLEEIVSSGSGGINELNVGWFKSIEVATFTTLDEFYQEFKEPSNTKCLETPVSLWKP